MTLRNQAFFCILIPLIFIYYTKIALADYFKAIFTQTYDDNEYQNYNQEQITLNQSDNNLKDEILLNGQIFNNGQKSGKNKKQSSNKG